MKFLSENICSTVLQADESNQYGYFWIVRQDSFFSAFAVSGNSIITIILASTIFYRKTKLNQLGEVTSDCFSINFHFILFFYQVLYLLLRKLLEKSEWDAEWGRVLLAAYESVRPLKPYERQDLFYRLSYPEKLWKIVNFYYNSGKAWIPEKNQEKLDRLLEQEAARKKFLKLLQR